MEINTCYPLDNTLIGLSLPGRNDRKEIPASPGNATCVFQLVAILLID
jgi:hypothetical protein